MKTKTGRRTAKKVTVKLPDLGLTQKQLIALKKDFKNLVVATLGAEHKTLTYFIVPSIRRRAPRAGKAPKKSKRT